MTFCQFIADKNDPLLKVCQKCKRKMRSKYPPENCHAMCRKGGERKPSALLHFDDLPCIHRGAIVGEVTCSTCPLKGKVAPIAECAIHGQCVPRRYTKGSMSQANCATCSDRRSSTESDGAI